MVEAKSRFSSPPPYTSTSQLWKIGSYTTALPRYPSSISSQEACTCKNTNPEPKRYTATFLLYTNWQYLNDWRRHDPFSGVVWVTLTWLLFTSHPFLFILVMNPLKSEGFPPDVRPSPPRLSFFVGQNQVYSLEIDSNRKFLSLPYVSKF